MEDEKLKLFEKDRVKVGNFEVDFTDPTEGGVVSVHDERLNVTNIERLGMADKIFEWILEGRTKKWILKTLHLQFPEHRFTIKEIDYVMNRNPELSKAIIKQDKQLMKRHALINLDYREKLLSVQEELEDLLEMAKKDREYSSSIAAINTMLKNITLIAKLKGDIDQPTTNVNVNLGDQVAEVVADRNSSLRSRILEQTIDITPVENSNTENGNT